MENSAKHDIFRSVRQLVRNHLRFFLMFSAAALLLRLIFLFRFPGVVTDSFIYGDIAKNWLQHGIYGLSGGEISPTYIRLPGYPAFLALIFAIFGVDHYRAVLFVQTLVDLGTCFLCAAIALRLLGPKSAKFAFALAGLVPVSGGVLRRGFDRDARNLLHYPCPISGSSRVRSRRRSRLGRLRTGVRRCDSAASRWRLYC